MTTCSTADNGVQDEGEGDELTVIAPQPPKAEDAIEAAAALPYFSSSLREGILKGAMMTFPGPFAGTIIVPHAPPEN